jgi:hypothetical protein
MCRLVGHDTHNESKAGEDENAWAGHARADELKSENDAKYPAGNSAAAIYGSIPQQH